MYWVEFTGVGPEAGADAPLPEPAPETCTIDLDKHINRNVTSAAFGIEGASTIQ